MTTRVAATTESRLSDQELMRGFENASLTPGEFHHAEHVRVAWLYLQRYEPSEALHRYVADIRRLSNVLGAPERYHETITWAYLLLIGERLVANESWEEFELRNADLFDWEESVLSRYYSPELLASERARRRFVFPDRAA
jgi:hypothetical protein